eukprot:TRINITY_DN1484_c2_g1_i1.p2 TRINITY_DN1484_c2_g1~~TRINITY_DN1484_c2_g1_i1.p2  ORF type:complete len:441 (-),score=54.42 TRINITY_DN1484_c2_g1_i1:281-1417(-)
MSNWSLQPQTENNDAKQQQQKGIDTERMEPVYQEFADRESGLLHCNQVINVLAKLEIHVNAKHVESVVRSIVGDGQYLSLEETLAVCKLVGFSYPGSLPENKKFLTQRRNYLESGVLNREEVVLQFVDKLATHVRKCESEGRYLEARASAQKLAQLKTIEAAHVREDMLTRHAGEKRSVAKIFEDELAEANKEWKERQLQYKQQIQDQFKQLQERQKNELEQFYALKESRRPLKPRYSRDLLNQRMIQQHLAKQGQYRKADVLQRMTNVRETTEFAKTMSDFEKEWGAKEKQLLNRHQQELHTLKQRAMRGRNELKSEQQRQQERRQKRYNNLLHDLDNLQKVEIAQLEAFLEGQALAGKRKHLPETKFRKLQQNPQE